MKIAIGPILTATLLSTTISSQAFARDIACDSLGGGVLFKDMFYGIGIGGVIGGLAYAAGDNDKNDGGKIAAQGALVGSVLGLGVGIWEFSSRDCVDAQPSEPQHLNQAPKSYHFSSQKFGWSQPKVSYVPARKSDPSAWQLGLDFNF
ncbi:hypothetical protein [Pseudobacteriovorax antillogorgiicola]|uniref:Uncharacterized protein n=1 Tax=Pseudobacteriovorax antillogorgiicola TaxID=1513793 RepID=A0A1Y6C5X6_9BACT|nr:hypothetical protein [Pseudobacteriovorax antillogorgiicola]TCS49846.1 hypothetical protein EDD56_11491 [Pseudobacteriovorax antillogorgiicola]SMF43674.1 hypothetical protein SAMN06296036_11390 [Pseudobacteriovorax antillogorgiicola]